ncbi:MAG: FAD-binding protein [Rhodoferax sp.]|nr:MAG: FAD-binding protein [Rhodoferax sp.]
MQVAVIGAGWAGLSAAVHACQAGHRVTVFEASHTPGGRARALDITLADGQTTTVDNGQHILIGAYSATLALMRSVGVDTDSALLRLPLVMQYPDGSGLRLPRWPAPLDALAGVLTAKGWGWGARLSMLKRSLRWQWQGFDCAPQASVHDLCRGLHPQVLQSLIEPLCVSALNTPMERASGQVFLRVLKDSLFGGNGASNLLLPRTDLGRVLPEAALAWLHNQGATVQLGRRVRNLQTTVTGWQVDGQPFDAVILATSAQNAASALMEYARTASNSIATDIQTWCRTSAALQYEAIATVYTQATGARLPQPMLALPSDGTHPAQFVFDRGQLGGPSGLWAFVVSAATGEREAMAQAVCVQVRAQLAPYLGDTPLQLLQTVVEKRATFACTPALQRPPEAIAPGLWACGDYVQGPYPATLEGAVRSGASVAAQLGR